MVNYIQKHEPSGEDRVKSSERDLWVAVLGRALLDAFQQAPHLNLNLKMNRTHDMYYKYNRDQARHFFLDGGEYFKEVCEMAGRNPQYVKEKVRKLILKANGWNVDKPISFPSKYRKRKKQKGLTGNAYYAAKARKEI
jgi:hypothetical protein|tara:strand:- start:2291 stop:2704 length:414 start_codon:yes stop_codon:yes gene_type:complete